MEIEDITENLIDDYIRHLPLAVYMDFESIRTDLTSLLNDIIEDVAYFMESTYNCTRRDVQDYIIEHASFERIGRMMHEDSDSEYVPSFVINEILQLTFLKEN